MKIGMAIVFAILIGFVGFRIMRDVPIFRLGTVLYATYPKVDGLTAGSPINISGIKIGSVRAMQILPNDSVLVTLNINMIDGLPVGSIAYIRATDLLGSKAVEIERSLSTNLIPPNSKIEGRYDEGAFAGMAEMGKNLGDKVTEGTESITSVLAQVDSVLLDGGREDMSLILENLNKVTTDMRSVMEDRQKDINSTIQNVESLTSRLDKLTEEESAKVSEALTSLKEASAEIETLVTGLNETNQELSEILAKINSGQGSLGLLVNDPSLYNNLDSLSANLNIMIKTLNENPKHYLRHLRLIRLF
jgi:ABC-type transporter Mla subunit MlaD